MIEQYEHDGHRVPITKIHVHPIYGLVAGFVLYIVGFFLLAAATGLSILWLKLVGAAVFIGGPILYFTAGEATHKYVIQIRGGERRTVTTHWKPL